jgi:1-acyl-sn-glycerol-3-phosphate acyltransferase
MNLLYRLGHPLVRLYFRSLYRLREVNAAVVPRTGGLILAANHSSYLDPPVIGSAITQRELHYMARSTLFRNPFFGLLIRCLNSYAIMRGQGPDQDWGKFLRVLDRGGALLVFPEGTRSADGTLQRGKSGFGRLVHLSRKPVYPVYVQGAYEAFPREGKSRFLPITVYFGPPVPLDDLLAKSGEKRTLREISERTMAAIAEIKQSVENRK